MKLEKSINLVRETHHENQIYGYYFWATPFSKTRVSHYNLDLWCDYIYLDTD